jgi:hypothetical protein
LGDEYGLLHRKKGAAFREIPFLARKKNAYRKRGKEENEWQRRRKRRPR